MKFDCIFRGGSWRHRVGQKRERNIYIFFIIEFINTYYLFYDVKLVNKCSIIGGGTGDDN